MQYRDSRQEVTGLIVNRLINTRPEYRRMARAMTHRLATTGKFQITEMTPDAAGKLEPKKVDGSIHHLQGMFGFIDWIDLQFKKGNRTEDGPPTSADKVYKRFLLHRDFWASSLPVILCEGKTDSVYLRGAMRRLAKAHPTLISSSAKGNSKYKVRFFNYSYTAQRILDISGGASAVKSFITDYIKSVKKIPAPAKQQPLILLLDNDSGGKVFYSLIKQYNAKYSGTKTLIDGMDDFYHLAANVYIVFTPIGKPGDDSSIEEFFEPALLKKPLDGKLFNPSNEEIDEDTELGKTVFATKVVRPNMAKINFDGFDPILSRLEAVLGVHKSTV